MSSDPRSGDASTERLLDTLVRDAAPVEPIRSPGSVLAGIAGFYVAWCLTCIWLLGGLRDLDSFADVVSDGFFVGLVASLAGATGAAIAAREPGRDGAVRGALALAAIGLGAMLGTFAARVGEPGDVFRLGAEVACLAHVLGLGVVPAAALLGVALGGWRGRPLRTSLAASTSGAALAAIAVHVTCPAQGAWHVMLGHYGFPLAVAAATACVVGACWRWVAHR